MPARPPYIPRINLKLKVHTRTHKNYYYYRLLCTLQEKRVRESGPGENILKNIDRRLRGVSAHTDTFHTPSVT